MIESRLPERTGSNCESRPEAQNIETTETRPLEFKARARLDAQNRVSCYRDIIWFPPIKCLILKTKLANRDFSFSYTTRKESRSQPSPSKYISIAFDQLDRKTSFKQPTRPIAGQRIASEHVFCMLQENENPRLVGADN